MAGVANAQVRCCNWFSGAVVNGAAGGVLGYLGANWFTKINPMDGAVFGVVIALIDAITKPIFQSIFERPGADENAKCAGQVLNFVTVVAISLAICGAFGIQLTFETGCALVISQIATVVIGTFALACLCILCLAAVI